MTRLLLIILLLIAVNASALTVRHQPAAPITVAEESDTCSPLPDYQAWPEYPAGPVYLLPGADLHLQLAPTPGDPLVSAITGVLYRLDQPISASRTLQMEVAEWRADGITDMSWSCTADNGIGYPCDHPDTLLPTWRDDYWPVWDNPVESDTWDRAWTFPVIQPYDEHVLELTSAAIADVLNDGSLDIRIPADLTLEMQDHPGQLYVTTVDAAGTVSGISIPITPYPTVTRIP